VLLIDTEGLDFTVLKSLEKVRSRPRIIVTEDFAGTNEEKYAFLTQQKYRYVGSWGSDSFWINESHPADAKCLRLPVFRLPEVWEPTGKLADPGRVMFDQNASFGCTVAGWAWTEINKQPEPNIVIALHRVDSGDTYIFQAWRTPRPDVAAVFESRHLLMSGFRAHVDVPMGEYELIVLQQSAGYYSRDSARRIFLPLSG
jgi:hypothetical protein